MKNIAIFASGAGSNAKKIIEHFAGDTKLKVALVVTNKPTAGVVQIAKENGLPTLVVEKDRFFRDDAYVAELAHYDIDLLVLAGFLWKIPDRLIHAFPLRIINIHPALLPKYGGKGMFGEHVHRAVLENGETESGITIHFVDEHYDNGDIIFQAKCPVMPGDSAQSLASRIHELEHAHYPGVIAEVLAKLSKTGW